MSLENNIQNQIKEAMKAKDSVRLESLRAIKSAILLEQTQSGEKKEIPNEGEIKILQKLVKQRKESAAIYKQKEREDLAEREEQQAKIITEFLPQQLSESQIEKEIDGIINQLNAESIKDMGRVMSVASKKIAVQLDRISDFGSEGWGFESSWDVIVEPARKIRIGNKLYLGEEERLIAEVIDNTTSRGRTIRFLFDKSYEDFQRKLKKIGKVPLPYYITRPPEELDKEYYNTIYAKKEGSAATPAAGLHFSKHLYRRLQIKGIDLLELTLHIGLETLNPVEVEDLYKHKINSESLLIDSFLASKVNKAKKENKKICAVGTSVMKGIESSVSTDRYLNPFDGWTYKYIFPPYDFSIADCMITNFHLPKSTLLMLVAAFGGYEFVKKAYDIAIKEKYRFYSYGDAMLIL